MNKKLIVIGILVISTLTLMSCSKKEEFVPVEENANYGQKAGEFVNSLFKEEYNHCIEQLSKETQKALSEEKLKEAWETTIKNSGKFIKLEKTEIDNKDGHQIITNYCVFKENGVAIRLTYDGTEKITGVWFEYYTPVSTPVSTIVPIPKTLEEVDVTVGKGTEWELAGKIAKKKGKQAEAAVVLVQGSGPSDMDETIFVNKPFRDIAWGLAEQGIDVLRYDKRTFTHAEKFVKMDMSKFTVEEETIQDAITAANILKDQGYKKIYLVGHSLGGMLAPRIEKESNGLFEGLILLAGSPRKLTDIALDQNEAMIASFTDKKQIEESKKIVESEKEKMSKLYTWSEEEVSQNTILGMPAYYIKDLNESDTVALAKEIKKPMLILQGKKDFQVYAEKDFLLWKEVLKENEKVEFVLYEELNHLFMVSQGEKVGTVEEYQTLGKVDQKVIDDIATFIKKQ